MIGVFERMIKDAIIVEAAEQDLKLTPTKNSLPLIDMLASRMTSADVFLPAMLHMLKKSDVYGLSVRYGPQQLPPELLEDLQPVVQKQELRGCAQAYCVVEATSGGTKEKIGEEGWKLITKGVKDALETGAAQPGSAEVTLTAFCTLDTIQDFQLHPPRGCKTQHALIVVSDICPASEGEQPNLIVDSVMLLHRDDVEEIKQAMQRMLYYTAATAEVSSRKTKREWTENFSPAKANKCREISRHPTGDGLPEYKI